MLNNEKYIECILNYTRVMGRWKLRLVGAYSLLNPYYHIPLL